MYVHSVKLINYKSLGDYQESEIIIEPTVTAIVGKNESGKSNVIDGLSQIDFIGNNPTAYAPEKINRSVPQGEQIQYIVTIKSTAEDVEKGINDDTLILLSKNNYEMSGGLLTQYNRTVSQICKMISDRVL